MLDTRKLTSNQPEQYFRNLHVTRRKTYFAVNVSDDCPNGEEHDVQSHMFRPTITDMQDKYMRASSFSYNHVSML